MKTRSEEDGPLRQAAENERINPDRRAVRWTPTTVSWLSFLIMGLVVGGIGLTGTAYVIGYLHDRMTAHGLEHNREIAERLQPWLAARVLRSGDGAPETYAEMAANLGVFGYRILIIDRQQRRLVADSHSERELPIDLASSWMGELVEVGEQGNGAQPIAGPARATAEDGHPILIWLQEVATEGATSGRWLFGVASDQKNLTEFLGDLHWHLDGVMLLSYVLIAVLGYFAMRGIGRVYERNLEMQIRERTLALQVAHEEMLSKTKLAIIGQTASVLAHEMRNPLASIKLALSGLSKGGAVPERARRRVELVLGEVDRLDALLTESLDYVRPVKLSTRPVALDQLLDLVIQRQKPLIEERALTIRRQECTGCDAIRLDEEKMHQVLLNLLKNAIEASPNNGEIRIRHQRDGRWAVLKIANGGEPLGAETIERAFEPFYTTKPRGSGLGLSLVKRVVEEHGGRVVLASDPKHGTRVTLCLPVSGRETGVVGAERVGDSLRRPSNRFNESSKNSSD